MVVRRRRLSVLWAAAIVLVTVLVCSGVARAVTYGQPDGNDHPYVGLVAFYDNNGTYLWRCSGTLLSPTVFLTAGHCTDNSETASARVWFDSEVSRPPFPDSGGVTGTPYTHPNYQEQIAPQLDRSDVGVVVLDQPVEMATYGQLPQLGFLDKLATRRGTQEQTFTVVGYGLQSVRPNFQESLVRYKGTVSLIDLKSAFSDGYNIQITNNPGKRSTGGTCYGDSGGPLLYDNSNLVVGISSIGNNQNCKGTSYFYRTDIANTQNFVNQFLR